MRTETLLAGDATPMRTLAFGSSVPEGFVFSPDGRYLYGSSYYTGVSNIYRYEIATDKTEAVSNAETGFFRPVPLTDDELLVFNYTADGFVPAMIRPQPTEDLSAITFLGEQMATQHPVVQGWSAGSPARSTTRRRSSARGPTGRRASSVWSHLSRSSKATRIRSGRAACAIQRPDRLQHGAGHRQLQTGHELTSKERAAQRASSTRSSGSWYSTGMPATSTTCSGRPSAAAKATARSSPTTVQSSTGRRRP